jgi:hypothetical protein
MTEDGGRTTEIGNGSSPRYRMAKICLSAVRLPSSVL